MIGCAIVVTAMCGIWQCADANIALVVETRGDLAFGGARMFQLVSPLFG